MGSDDSQGTPAQPVDTGVGADVVTITAPTATLNWALLAAVAFGVWWLYSQWESGAEHDYEDE